MVCDMYRAYQCGRIADESIEDKVIREAVHSVESEIIDENEAHIISLYQQFQCTRTSNRELIIENVMALARIYAAQNSNDQDMALENPGTKQKNRVSLWHKAQIWFRSGSIGGWQTAAVFSVTLAIISVVSLEYNSEDVSGLNEVASIPNVLYEHASEVVPYIQPNLDSQFGFSSSPESQQSAFRSGVLLVQLQMLAKANELDKLRKVLVTSTLFLRRTNKTELVTALDRLVTNVEASNGKDNRMFYISSFEEAMQDYFSGQGVFPLLEFGKWIEISLLSSQLSEANRATLFNRLLPQGRDIVNQARTYLSADPGILAYIEETLDQDRDIGASAQDVAELQKKLERIKAALQ